MYWFSTWFQWSAHLPASFLVVPFLAATWEIHHGTYLASHVVGQDAPELHQVNGVLPPPEDSFLCIKHLEEIGLGFWTFLIAYHILQCCMSYPTWGIIVYHNYIRWHY